MLSARAENENEDKEWMYRLEDQGPLCNDAVSQAVVMCRKEHFLDALTILQGECLPAHQSKMTRRLQKKVQKIVDKGFRFADFVSCYEDGGGGGLCFILSCRRRGLSHKRHIKLRFDVSSYMHFIYKLVCKVNSFVSKSFLSYSRSGVYKYNF